MKLKFVHVESMVFLDKIYIGTVYYNSENNHWTLQHRNPHQTTKMKTTGIHSFKNLRKELKKNIKIKMPSTEATLIERIKI